MKKKIENTTSAREARDLKAIENAFRGMKSLGAFIQDVKKQEKKA